ncbi:MAG: hypothetical protein WD025_00240, partial [Bacteriovoracaceae bacterium]
FLEYQKLPDPRDSKKSFPVLEIIQDNRVDVLWIVDDSGSMKPIQNNIIRNAETFMQEFTKIKYLNWKLGLISTDPTDDTFLGFEEPFDAQTTAPVEIFKMAVGSLGASGGNEKVFSNIDKHLSDFDGSNPDRAAFVRRKSHLAIIMVTDEKEQSRGAKYDPMAFINNLKGRLSPNKNLRFYGALSLDGVGNCRSGDSSQYPGSPYETVVNETGGFTIPACENFGTRLADIGKDIVSLLDSIKLLLMDRPVIETLKVFYRGEELPPGSREDGGYWYYDSFSNTINFYSLKFIEDLERDVLEVDFEIDDGWDRD